MCMECMLTRQGVHPGLYDRDTAVAHAEGSGFRQLRQAAGQHICQAACCTLQGLKAAALSVVRLCSLLWQVAPAPISS